MAKGTLTLRDKALVVDSREAWAARFGGPSIRWGTGPEGGCPFDGNRVPHVHPRHGALGPGFNIDPRTGRWLSPNREAS